MHGCIAEYAYFSTYPPNLKITLIIDKVGSPVFRKRVDYLVEKFAEGGKGSEL